MKPDAHRVIPIAQAERQNWACGFGRCTKPADFLIQSYFGDERHDKGACKKCAHRWATKDECAGCLRVIDRIQTGEGNARD